MHIRHIHFCDIIASEEVVIISYVVVHIIVGDTFTKIVVR